MQNDVLKNKIAPWEEKGRWYHALYDASTGSFDPNNTDPLLLDTTKFTIGTLGTNYMVLIPNAAASGKYSIVDVKSIPHDDIVIISGSSGLSATGNRVLQTTRPNGFSFTFVPNTTFINAGHFDVWFFIIKNV